MTDATYTWRDPRPLAGATVVWMYILLIASIANLAMVGIEFEALLGRSPGDVLTAGTGQLNIDLMATVTRAIAFVVYAVAGVLFLKWTYRVTANARLLKSDMRAKPGWAIGWYFVPIAFLWKPFEYFKETWEVSHNPSSPAQVNTPGLLRWWWGLWLISTIAGNVSGRLAMTGDSVGAMQASDAFEMASDAATIPLIFIVVRILRRLSEQQGSGQASAEVFA